MSTKKGRESGLLDLNRYIRDEIAKIHIRTLRIFVKRPRVTVDQEAVREALDLTDEKLRRNGTRQKP